MGKYFPMLIDNFTEFKRSIENPEFIVKCYETNLLILVQEYVTVMDDDEFKANEVPIKMMLKELSEDFIFEDIGFTTKNHTNFGYRANGDIVILDAGYIYPFGPNREKILTCPKCHNRISYNRDFTGFGCRECKTRYSFIDIRRSTMALNKDVEDIENQMISKLNRIEMPDFASFDTRMFNKGL